MKKAGSFAGFWTFGPLDLWTLVDLDLYME